MNIIKAPARGRSTLLLLSCLLLAFFAAGAYAQNAFQGIGLLSGRDSSEAFGISGDGTTVVGNANDSGAQQTAIRWSNSTALASLNVMTNTSMAFAASLDGSVIVGVASSDHDEAFRWDSSGPQFLGLGGGVGSQAQDVSADGTVVVGFFVSSLSSPHAFRWTASTNIVALAEPLGTFQSQANSVSADGQVIVGSITDLTGTHAVRWIGAAIDVLGPPLSGLPNNVALAVSQDGSVIVGTSTDNINTRAFRWTSPGGMQALPTQALSATGVSGDGNIVVGGASFGAYIWDSGHGVREIKAVLASSGVTDANTWTLSSDNLYSPSISADGTKIAGLGFDGSAFEGWRATIIGNPVVTITGPPAGTIQRAGLPISFNGTFTDTNVAHTATWTFTSSANTIVVPGTISQSGNNGTVSLNYAFANAGVYDVKLTVTATADGRHGEATTVAGSPASVVIYDPSAGFIIGAGRINSPPGAYVANPLLTGPAAFVFLAKYRHGNTVPDGATEFRFRIANLNFESSTFDWLVITGAKGQVRGHGTVNGGGSYSFLLTGVDGQEPGGGGFDRYRMKIWVTSTGAIVYDNQMGAADGDPLSNGTIITQGRVKIVSH